MFLSSLLTHRLTYSFIFPTKMRSYSTCAFCIFKTYLELPAKEPKTHGLMGCGEQLRAESIIITVRNEINYIWSILRQECGRNA